MDGSQRRKKRLKLAAGIIAGSFLVLVTAAILAFLLFGPKAIMPAKEEPDWTASHVAEVSAQKQPSIQRLSYVRSAEAKEPTTERKLVREGDIDLEVKSIKAAIEDIRRITGKLGGLVFEIDNSSWSDSETGHVVIKVPAQAFDEAMESLRKIALKVRKENISTEDVTERYIDYEAKIKNMRAEEASLLRLMNRAEKIEDLISINKELGRVRGDLDSLQGKLNYLKGQIAMSTITVRLYTEAEIKVGEWDIKKTIKSSYVNLANGLRGFVGFLIKAVFYLPVILLYLAFSGSLIYMVFRLIKRFARRGPRAEADTRSPSNED